MQGQCSGVAAVVAVVVSLNSLPCQEKLYKAQCHCNIHLLLHNRAGTSASIYVCIYIYTHTHIYIP